jgi:glyoxylase-like metal-dependent hydrolase (beta-lactamase superfamily II)
MTARIPTLLAFVPLLVGCGRAIAPLEIPGSSAVALTSGPNTSMIFVARTADGILTIDLGWWGHEDALTGALTRLNATRADVRHVLLTHSHRDHIGAWQSLRHARFYLSDAERALLLGDSTHRAWIPRLADKLDPPALPRPGELTLTTFAGDTTFVVGTDTLRAYVVAGHTAGATVYLFRGTLFLGDAVTHSRFGGFAPARRGFSDDRASAKESLDKLWPRLPPGVRYACTAHARCAPYTRQFLEDVAR